MLPAVAVARLMRSAELEVASAIASPSALERNRMRKKLRKQAKKARMQSGEDVVVLALARTCGSTTASSLQLGPFPIDSAGTQQ